jgi:hypothetical protein
MHMRVVISLTLAAAAMPVRRNTAALCPASPVVIDGTLPSVYYSFDSVSGSNIFNNGTSSSLQGALAGGAIIAAGGVCGNAVSLPLGTSHVTVGSAGLALPASGWTVSAWVFNIKSTGYRTLFRGFNGDHQILMPINSNMLGSWHNLPNVAEANIDVQFRSSGFNMSTIVADGRWHHVAAVGAANQTSFYVDGLFAGVASFQSTTDVYSVGNFFMNGGQQLFADRVDEVYLFARAFSPSQMATLFAATTQLPTTTTTTTPTTTTPTTTTTTTTTVTTTTVCLGKIV